MYAQLDALTDALLDAQSLCGPDRVGVALAFACLVLFAVALAASARVSDSLEDARAADPDAHLFPSPDEVWTVFGLYAVAVGVGATAALCFALV